MKIKTKEGIDKVRDREGKRKMVIRKYRARRKGRFWTYPRQNLPPLDSAEVGKARWSKAGLEHHTPALPCSTPPCSTLYIS